MFQMAPAINVPSLLASCLAFAISASPSRGDVTQEVLYGMLIQDVRASATEEGGSTRLSFRIENASGRTQILDAVQSDDAEVGSLLIVDDGVETPAAAGLLMLDHETLNLGTSHIRVLLHGLKRPLKEGDVIAFQAVFREGTIAAQGHVHATMDN